MVLLTGAKGQLGYDFQRLFQKEKVEFIATDFQELDITQIDSVRSFVKDKPIDIIINCAAYNNVDKAETDKEACYALNYNAVSALAQIAKEKGALFVTYSTDFVFDGEKTEPYTEEDLPRPLSVYGQTKYNGEKAVLSTHPRSFVIRTSWVFGVGNNNFNKKILQWSQTNKELSFAADQRSVPTYAKDLAYFSWKLIQTEQFGLYHFSNAGEASKYDQAVYLLNKTGWTGVLRKAKSSDFPSPAKRPLYSKLACTKIEKLLNEKIPSWQSGMDRFIEELKERKEL